MADILDKIPVDDEMTIFKTQIEPIKLNACIDNILMRLDRLETSTHWMPMPELPQDGDAERLRELKELREENKVLISECDRLIKEKGELLQKVSGGDVLRICQLEEQLKHWKEEYANLNKISYDYYKELKEAKRLLKSAIDEWNLVCEWGNCGEYCGWYENGKCTQEWSGKAEALKLLND